MLRYFLYFSTGLVFIFSVLIGVSLTLGSGSNPPVLMALIGLRTAKPNTPQDQIIAFFDFQHRLRADHKIPLPDIYSTRFSFNPIGDLIVSTVHSDAPSDEHRWAGLYLYNYLTGTLTIMDTFETDVITAPQSPDEVAYLWVLSPDGRKLAFMETMESDLHLYDRTDGHRITIETPLHREYIYLGPIWSQDGGYIYISGKDENSGYLVSVEDARIFELLTETLHFSWHWETDTRYLSMHTYGIDVSPIQPPLIMRISVINSSALLPSERLNAHVNPLPACGGQWSEYFVNVTPTQKTSYLLNNYTGERFQLDHLLALTNLYKIDVVNPLPGCQQFVLDGISTSNTLANWDRPKRSFYLYDLDTQNIEVLVEDVYLIRQTDDLLTYETPDPVLNRFHVFNYPLNPLGVPTLVGDYPHPDTYQVNWFNDISFAIVSGWNSSGESGSKLSHLDFHTGQMYPLTSDNEHVRDYLLVSWRDARMAGQP